MKYKLITSAVLSLLFAGAMHADDSVKNDSAFLPKNQAVPFHIYRVKNYVRYHLGICLLYCRDACRDLSSQIQRQLPLKRVSLSWSEVKVP